MQQVEKEIHNHLGTESDTLIGVLCFSESFNNPMLWGHYADNCRGICLGFDVYVYYEQHKDIVWPVNYVAGRLDIREFSDLLNYDEVNMVFGNEDVEANKRRLDQIKTLYFTKSHQWKYEKEWRAWIVGQRDPVSNLYFHSFGNRLILREISVGFRCSLENIKYRLDRLVGEYPDPPKIFSTQRSLASFEIEKMPFR